MSAIEGLRQVGQFVKPANMRRLREAGAVSPLSPIAVSAALPWLLGRGPSLGVVSQMNSLVVGGKPAIHDRDGSLTWRELDGRANRLAHALIGAGVQPGETIAALLRNGREFVELLLATQKAGFVAAPLNTWGKTRELAASIENAQPRLLLYDVKHKEQVEAIRPDGLPLVAAGDPTEALAGSTPYDEFLARGAGRPPAPFTRKRAVPKVIIHTSGTTGAPKGARRDASAAGVSALTNLLQVIPYRRDDIVLCPAPLFHSFGLATVTFAIALGATLVLPERFGPEESLRLIERHRATAASFVPVMIRRICNLPPEERACDLSSLRVVLASGSAMSPELRRAASEVFGPVVYDLYGSTEAGWVSIATPEDLEKRPTSVGRPVPGIELALFDGDGKRVAAGAPGEIFVRSEVAFEGYTGGGSRQEREGFLSIGDVGRQDEEGYLFIEGRADDMVVVGGENVYPVEVEAAIEGVPGVQEAAVLGIEDPEYGQVLAAAVVGDVTEQQVIEACRSELASYKVPRRVAVVDDLPRTGTGKVIKARVRELLEK
ncbi:MAG TPA: AMP-binding protein [Actinomycetota bacterium]|nr:AMP-binding protein [Actinomycetota bacterium]